MNETEPFYYNNYKCDEWQIFGAFVTAWIWIAFNKVIIGVTFCYGSAITHKNVYAEYAVIWLICIFNFISCVLIMEVYFYGYDKYDYQDYIRKVLTKLRACLAMSCLGKFDFYILSDSLLLSTYFLGPRGNSSNQGALQGEKSTSARKCRCGNRSNYSI